MLSWIVNVAVETEQDGDFLDYAAFQNAVGFLRITAIVSAKEPVRTRFASKSQRLDIVVAWWNLEIIEAS